MLTAGAKVKLWTPDYALAPVTDAVFISGIQLPNAGAQLVAGHAGPPDGNGSPTWVPGIKFVGQATETGPFADGQHGIWSLVQLVAPSRFKTIKATQQSFHLFWNGMNGLDQNYPYFPSGFANNDDAGFDADGVVQSPSESPNMRLSAPDLLSRAEMSTAYYTFMMYRPPANQFGHQWVPLKEISWKADGVAALGLNNDWTADLFRTVGPVSVQFNIETSVHPRWNTVIEGDDFPWVAD